MNALLIIAHGSRNELANREVRDMSEEVARKGPEHIDLVRSAFLELAEPDIPGGIRECIEAGADRVFVFPYFLNTGVHVAKDIPAIIDEARERHPECTFLLLPHVGAPLKGMSELIVSMLPESEAPESDG